MTSNLPSAPCICRETSSAFTVIASSIPLGFTVPSIKARARSYGPQVMVSFSVIGGLFRETKLGGGQTRARQAKAGRVAEVKSRGLCQLFEPDRGGPAGSGAISSEASGKGAAR